MEEVFNRASNDVMNDNHGSRVLPPSMKHTIPLPNMQYPGQSDLFRPGGVDEQAVGDERLIYQVALQVLVSFSRSLFQSQHVFSYMFH